MANNRRRGGWGFTPSLTGPGTVFTLAFISLAIGMGVLLSRGITPSNVLTEPDDKDVEVEIVPETPIPGQKGLQLKTIKFRECAATTAVTMQLDITGSMGGYMNDLKRAVLSFTDKLSDQSVIGIQAYNSLNSRVVVVPVSYYGDIKSLLRSRVLSLSADGNTPTYDALIFSGEVLKEAIPRFPDRKFNFIFFSDGNPNEGPSTPADIAQAAQTIKDQGVTVYSVGLGGVNPEIIRVVASSPDKAVIARRSADLERIYGEIQQKICQSQLSPTP